MDFSKIGKIMKPTIQNKKTPEEQNMTAQTRMDCIPELEELITCTNDYDSFYDVFDNLEAKKIGNFVNPTTFKINDIYVYLGFDKDADYYKNLFTELNKSNVSFAPKYIKSVNSKAGFSATFTQIKDTYNDNLKDFNKLYANISKQTKKDAYADVQKLLKLGIINNKILTRNAFEVTPNMQYIVISDWDSVSRVSSNEDKLKFLNVARETLFRE